MKRLMSIILAVSLLAMPFAIAQQTVTTTTQVQFNIGTVVAFTLTLPGQGAVTANSTGAPTAGIEFNSTTGTDSDVDPRVAGGGTQQSDGTPIFEYDNTGTVDLNISVSLDTDTPSCINLTGATTFAAANNGSQINSGANVTVVNSYTPAAAAQDWYMKADFTACVAGDTSTRTLTSFGVQTS